ncbi:MAG TPA: GFA family protein [Paracoccus sp. (in: a-proteobacteria)]|uniref:GFA family protein n=1 Tax=uncultured Paracoccus sp. TaxID=189685 RepID=UPI002634963D|nr:GFA family protein [uncultured Paracoccus sp.]HMQ40829.1 GFA family protein [Paracoccus sp. (in: a-proteobacteria)]HMR35486.1 GFA family protein [Paracoccus sp. (in: a-proteobacteria)]
MSLPEIQSPHRLTCHCGAVELAVTLSDGLNSKRRCDCSFCRRRGAVAVSARLDGIRIVRGEDALSLYQFNTGSAKHYFCRHCGIYTHHQRRSNPNEYGVNAGALEGVNPRDLDPVPWNDGVNHPSDR